MLTTFSLHKHDSTDSLCVIIWHFNYLKLCFDYCLMRNRIMHVLLKLSLKSNKHLSRFDCKCTSSVSGFVLPKDT